MPASPHCLHWLLSLSLCRTPSSCLLSPCAPTPPILPFSPPSFLSTVTPDSNKWCGARGRCSSGRPGRIEQESKRNKGETAYDQWLLTTDWDRALWHPLTPTPSTHFHSPRQSHVCTSTVAKLTGNNFLFPFFSRIHLNTTATENGLLFQSANLKTQSNCAISWKP